MDVSRRTAILYSISKRTLKFAVILTVLVLIAYTCRITSMFLSQGSVSGLALGLIRSFIYTGIFFAWGVSVSRRIIQKHTKWYMVTTAMLMVLWFTLRTLKFHVVNDPTAQRLLWYMYYIPMLMLPVFILFTSISLRKSENYRLPTVIKLFALPAAVFVILVLTNDMHELVFLFMRDSENMIPLYDMPYSYGLCYWIMQLWNGMVVLMSLVIMIEKCRSPKLGRPKLLPLIPAMLMLVYGALYVYGAAWLRVILGDMTAVNCLLCMLMLEACIGCRLIPSNTGHSDMFEVCSIDAKITDSDLNVRYDSDEKNMPARELLSQAATGGYVRYDRDTLIKGKSIPGGYIFWREDIKDLIDVMEQLEITRNALARKNEIERKKLETERNVSSLREHNRLYDLISSNTERQRGLLLELFEEYKNECAADCADDARKRELLARAAVIGAYIKRKGNLLFLRQQSAYMPAAELRHAIEETFSNLELTGTECGLMMNKKNKWAERDKENDTEAQSLLMNIDDAMRAYHMLERMIEMSFGRLDSVYVVIRESDGSWKFTGEAESSADLSAVVQLSDSCRARGADKENNGENDSDNDEGYYSFTVNIRARYVTARDAAAEQSGRKDEGAVTELKERG